MGGQVGSVQSIKPAKRDKPKPRKSEGISTNDKMVAESHYGEQKESQKIPLLSGGSQAYGNKVEKERGYAGS